VRLCGVLLAILVGLRAHGGNSLLTDDWRLTAFDDAPSALSVRFGKGTLDLKVLSDVHPGIARARRIWSLWQKLPTFDPNGTLKLSFEAHNASPREFYLICSTSGAPGCDLPANRQTAWLTGVWKRFEFSYPMAGQKQDGVLEIVWEGEMKAGDTVSLRDIRLTADESADRPTIDVLRPFSLALPPGTAGREIAGRLAFPRKFLGGEWRVALSEPGGATLLEQTNGVSAANADFSLDAALIPDGRFELSFAATTPQGVQSEPIIRPIAKGKPASGAFYVANGRVMRDGKPFLPVVLSHCNRAAFSFVNRTKGDPLRPDVTPEAGWRDIAEHGFNVVFAHAFGKDADAFSADVAPFGLMAMPRLDRPWPPAENVFAWYGADEPASAAARARGRERYAFAKTSESPRLVYSSMYDAATCESFFTEGAFCDVFELDFYAVRSKRTDFTQLSDLLARYAEAFARRPEMVFGFSPQAYVFNGPEPTPAQLRCQVYLGVAHGVRSYGFYAYTENFGNAFTDGKASFPEIPSGQTRNPMRTKWWLAESDLWDECGRLTKELHALEPFLFSDEKSRAVTCEDRCVALSARMVGKRLQLVAVNVRPDPVRVCVSSDRARTFKSAFGAAAVRLAAGANDIGFTPYEAKVLTEVE